MTEVYHHLGGDNVTLYILWIVLALLVLLVGFALEVFSSHNN